MWDPDPSLARLPDYGFGDASYKDAMYDGTASPPTPTIDKLALQGVRLEGYYVQKLCSPTRTALLSGRYAYTLGQETDVIVNGQDCDLALNLLTIADHLQRAGWNTSAYGKVRRHLSMRAQLCPHACAKQTLFARLSPHQLDTACAHGAAVGHGNDRLGQHPGMPRV